MRVTHVITRLIVGGAQENTVATVLGLQQKPNVHVNLISGPTSGPEGSMEDTVQAQPGMLTIIPSLVRPVHPVKDCLALLQLTRMFWATKPDVVHTHSGKAGILGRLAARRAQVPIIVHTIHGPSFGAFQGAFANFAFRSAERYAGRATTHFISVANAMSEQYLAAGIGRPEQYTRIFSGFDLKPFTTANNDPRLRQRLGIQPKDFVVGKIARLFELKGHDDLFAIAPALVKAHPSIKFLLVGDGKWRSRFELLAKTLNLEKHFIFTGLVPPAQVPGYIGITDALIHLSKREGLPRALPQALAAGRPVIAYDCDGANEVCIDGETGFLVRPGDLDALRQRILRLADDLGLRERLGRAGQCLVEKRFSSERMVEEIHGLYLRLGAR